MVLAIGKEKQSSKKKKRGIRIIDPDKIPFKGIKTFPVLLMLFLGWEEHELEKSLVPGILLSMDAGQGMALWFLWRCRIWEQL